MAGPTMCPDHQLGITPRFLRYATCTPCEELYALQRRESGKRRAKLTRVNRATAEINGRPASFVVRSFFACQLPKLDYWRRLHRWGRKRCLDCRRRKKVRVAA